MRITLRLILSLVAVIALVAFGFAAFQARTEEERLRRELELRSQIVADGLREALEPAWPSHVSDAQVVRTLLDKWTARERLAGISLHDTRGAAVVYSSNLAGQENAVSTAVSSHTQDIERFQTAQTDFGVVRGEPVLVFSVPVLFAEKEAYILSLFSRSDYISERVRRIWVNSFLRALIQSLFVGITVLLVFYFNVMRPIRRATDWIRRIRQGDPGARLHPKEQDLLGPLAKEISSMAKSLEAARTAAEEEARLRQSTESIWTPERLKEFVRVKLDGRPLFVVSNREPYMHVKKGKEIECIVPASGMVTALEPVLKACGGTWIAHGAGDADRETVDAGDRLRVPPQEPQYTLRRVWISKDEEEGYYYGFSNEGLWPLCHIAHTRPIFRESNWVHYREVNKKFAEVVLQELEGTQEPCVLVQDYHFALLPALIKQKRPDSRVAIFWHIPWPNPESFGICPWQKELLQGMLGADIIGFHTQYHCNNFIETIDRTLESRIDYEHFTVHREGQITWVKPFPISIDFVGSAKPEPAAEPTPQEKIDLLKPYGVQASLIGVGVDRLDYTKGIVERFLGLERFFELNSQYIGKFTFVELGAPSRSLIPKYQEFVDQVERECERINARFKTKNWKPILFLKKHHSHKDIEPFYKRADVCLVTSLHDGMNLVAKEFVMSREDERGVLILSPFTGAARELRDALIVNPYDIGGLADAILQALEMPSPEERRRMRSMRETVRGRNIYKWAADLVGEMAQLRLANAL